MILLEKVLKDIFARRLDDILMTSSRSLENVLKMSGRRFETSWRRFKDILKTSSKRLEDVLKMSWRCFCRTCWQRLENVWCMTKTNILLLSKAPWRRLEDVFWRCMTKANIFVLIKACWKRPEDVFWRGRRKTSSNVLQDVFIKKNVCWDVFYIIADFIVHATPQQKFYLIVSPSKLELPFFGVI